LDRIPTVSVILAVRNGGDDLPRAVETILGQTFADIELIIVNDGSADGTATYLDGIADPRVRVVHQTGAGLAASLNRGIALARGRYVARQDHDDIAAPTRIEKQIRFLENSPDHALVGTRAEIWVGDRPTGRFHDHPTDDSSLRFELLFNNPFVHSSVMMRKAALDEVGPYTTDPARQPPEDYELWSRIARRFRVANLPERLTVYREVTGSVSRTGENPFQEKLALISAENLAVASGCERPGPVHVAMARMVHGLRDNAAPRLDVRSMYDVLESAARHIAADELSADMVARLAKWKRNLRHHIRMQDLAYRGMWVAARRVRDGLRQFGLMSR
jgi:hypothetical protein